MLNIISYIIFLAVCFYITADVGRRCYNAGKPYLEYLIHDSDVCRTINKILLGCYYLVNLGYIAVSLTSWDRVSSIQEMITVTAVRIGNIILILSALHYLNIFALYFLRKNLTVK
ncbi:hypothetical protein [Chryseobacterium gregarium]|uniref:hypothetical protein n=1 Tax=Chryseobacterium gregarium TaxID=456299 RepID=UPI0004075921|nr:hypothetical protein [Chryseobacterium gregarium]